MRIRVRTTALSATLALGLALLSPALAEKQSVEDGVLDDSEHRIFTDVKGEDVGGDDRDWYGGGHGGGGGPTGGGAGGGGGKGGGGAVVPEPGTMALLGMGLAALGMARRRR